MALMKRIIFWSALIWIGGVTIFWLRLPSAGLIASYYPTMDWSGKPCLLHRESTLGLEFAGDLAKYAGFPPQDFSIAWNGWIRIDQEQEYRFGTTSKDGSSITLDQQPVVDNRSPTEKTVWGSIFLSKGLHQITITYFKQNPGDSLAVFWQNQQGQPAALPASALFPCRLTSDLEVFSRYLRLIYILYALAWGWLGFASLQRYWASRPVGGTCRALLLSGMQFGLLVMLGGIFYDNLQGLRAKQPFLNGYLVPKTDRKLSSALPYKGFGDSDSLFMTTVQQLYGGGTLWVPQDDVFIRDHLLQCGGLRAVQRYSQEVTLTRDEVKCFKIYHRFAYDPYGYRPDRDQRALALRQTFDLTRRPVFLYVIQPVHSEQTTKTVVAAFYQRDLYLVPIEQLPERLKVFIHE
jgi:hypothetical protein